MRYLLALLVVAGCGGSECADMSCKSGKIAARMTIVKWGQGATDAVATRKQVFNGPCVNAITIGPNSDWSSVRVKAARFSEPFLVSVERPWYGYLDGPLEITPDVVTPVSEMERAQLDLILWETPPAADFGQRAPLRIGRANSTLTSLWACIDGRTTVRTYIVNGNNGGPQNFTIAWIFHQVDGTEVYLTAAAFALAANAAIVHEWNPAKQLGNINPALAGTDWNGAHGIRISHGTPADAVAQIIIEGFDE